ncbi:unnamed protein product [Darwinula stevensoni]|uniref:Uncharacterized protein n=1 Tax=Darwinula stevensoni TaxID=69355 RepID=A0A7R9A4B0_9CRUS|nr:unnamed protein product [Darwinula stevensoni]CAG0889626.1 unnamed protein product [Darwinula stevensoni]
MWALEILISTPILPATVSLLEMPDRILVFSLFFLAASLPAASGQGQCPDRWDVFPCACVVGDFRSSVDCSNVGSVDRLYSWFPRPRRVETRGEYEVQDARCILNPVCGRREQPISPIAYHRSDTCEGWKGSDYFSGGRTSRPRRKAAHAQRVVLTFLLLDNDMVQELPEGVFGDVTFRIVTISNTALRHVHPMAILPLKDRISMLEITNCDLQDFPWEIIPQLNEWFNSLYLSNNALRYVPPLQTRNLVWLHLDGNQIAKLDSGWEIATLMNLKMEGNPLSEMPAGFFHNMPNFEEFLCKGCNLGPTLFSGIFEMRAPRLKIISLDENSISRVEPGAISGLPAVSVLYFMKNNISRLDEEAFYPMLRINGKLFVDVPMWTSPLEGLSPHHSIQVTAIPHVDHQEYLYSPSGGLAGDFS